MFNLRKRINRKTYWLGTLAFYVGLILFIILISVLPLSGTNNFEPQFDIPLLIILGGLFWFNICLARQRSNDISGTHPLAWMFFSVFLVGPVIGLISGEKGHNSFGPVPADFNLFDK